MRKFDLTDPVHRVGQSLVYYDQLDSILEKCRSMQGVKGIDGTVIFADRIKGEAADGFAPNCVPGVILKPEELALEDKAEVAPALAGAVSKALKSHSARLQWPNRLMRGEKTFGQLDCVVSKIKERWVYVIVIAHFHFDKSWEQGEQEIFLQELLHVLDEADQRSRQGEVLPLQEAYNEATGLIGRTVRITEDNRVLEGVVQEINTKGELAVKPQKGRAVRVIGKKVKGLEYLDVASE